MKEPKRCAWPLSGAMLEYHDKEWGVPVHDDRKHFEYLVLDAFQAGLSWAIVLSKREAFRKAFKNFDPAKVAKFGPADVARLTENAAIIRNRLKIEAAIENARRLLEVRNEFGSFDRFVWAFVGNRTIVNRWKTLAELPSRTEVSDRMSREMKVRGFKFCGSTICYSYMQAAGLVNDHTVDCFRYRELKKKYGDILLNSRR
jgi:DNA-3-methyladenine glycosylase I